MIDYALLLISVCILHIIVQSFNSGVVINLTELTILYILFRVRVERKEHAGRVVGGHEGVLSVNADNNLIVTCMFWPTLYSTYM